MRLALTIDRVAWSGITNVLNITVGSAARSAPWGIQMNISRRSLLPVAISSVLGVSAVATAQEASRVSTLEEIVVTAQKRSESLQEVPVAVSAFTDETRDLLGITTVQDFTNFTPGITYSVQTDRMFVRGIGRYTNNLATSPGVATYGDGFYNSSNHQAAASPLFTERVEVLRGPQGTLYGRNSIGGALNVVTRRPGEEFEGETRVRVGSRERRDAEFYISGPISDSVGFLIGGGKYTQDEGYIENIAGDDGEGKQDDVFAMAQLSFEIGDAVDIWLKYAYTEWNQGWGSSVNVFPYVTNLPSRSLVLSGSLGPSALYNTGPGMVPAAPQYLTPNPGVANSRQTNFDTAQFETLDPNHEVVLEIIGHLGFADLKYVGGYHDYLYTLTQDFDNSDRKSYLYTPSGPGSVPAPVEIQTQVVTTYVEDKQFYSNELNLISTNDGPLQWVIGAYQYHEYYEQPVRVGTPAQAQLATPQYFVGAVGTPAPGNPERSYSYTNAHITTSSLAGFGQIDYSFTDTFKASLGARYTKDKKYGEEFTRYITWNPTQFGAFAPAVDISPGTFGPNGGVPFADGSYTRHLAGEWDAVTGTAGLDWSPVEGGLGYVKYTRGYKDGGLNPGSIQANPYTDPEYVNAYELGWKQSLGGRFIANASVFFYDVKDSQIPLTIVRGAGLPNLTQTFNIDVESKGVELETIWSATDSLQLMLSYSLLDATLKDDGCYSDALDGSVTGPDLCPGGGHAIADNRVPGSPRNKVAFNTLYTVDFSPGSLIFSGSWTWRDNTYSSIFTRREWMAPAYDQIDARITWADAQDRFNIIAYGRNLLDEEGFDGVTATSTAGGITRSFSLTPPRHYGIEVHYRFGR